MSSDDELKNNMRRWEHFKYRVFQEKFEKQIHVSQRLLFIDTANIYEIKAIHLKISRWIFFRSIYMRIFLNKGNSRFRTLLRISVKGNGKNSNTAAEYFDICKPNIQYEIKEF